MRLHSFKWPFVLFAALLMTNSSLNLKAQCDSTDFALLCYDGEAVNDAVFSCGFSCAFAGDLTSCFASCISDAIPEMSSGCVSCFANQSTCVTNSCFLTCAFGSEADCEACVAAVCAVGARETILCDSLSSSCTVLASVTALSLDVSAPTDSRHGAGALAPSKNHPRS